MHKVQLRQTPLIKFKSDENFDMMRNKRLMDLWLYCYSSWESCAWVHSFTLWSFSWFSQFGKRKTIGHSIATVPKTFKSWQKKIWQRFRILHFWQIEQQRCPKMQTSSHVFQSRTLPWCANFDMGSESRIAQCRFVTNCKQTADNRLSPTTALMPH